MNQKNNDSIYHQNNERVDKIIDVIKKNPGIRFRRLASITNIPYSTLGYYADRFEKLNLVTIVRKDKTSRFFPMDTTEMEMAIFTALDLKNTKLIILTLLENPNVTFADIVKFTKKYESIISINLKHLVDAGLVSYSSGIKKKYFLTDTKTIQRCIQKLKHTSTLD